MTSQEYLHLMGDNALIYRKDIIIGQGSVVNETGVAPAQMGLTF